MEASRLTLASDRLEAEILLPAKEYAGSRYDHSCIVARATLDGRHDFLSREIIGDGFGLGGMGLSCAFDWETTEHYDETKMVDSFPLLGNHSLASYTQGRFRPHGRTSEELVDALLREGVTQHYAVAAGDSRAALRDLALILGLKCLEL